MGLKIIVNDIIDTKYFSIRKISTSNGLVDIDGLRVDFMSGETVYENRIYRHGEVSCVFMIITKIKDDRVFFTLTAVDDCNNRLLVNDLGWFDKDIYGDLVKKMEERFAKSLFYIYNIVPGRLYNVYFQN
jgi:hypothetical protein